MFRGVVLILILFLLSSKMSFSQGETNNWIFGAHDNWVIISDSGAVGYSPPINNPWTVDFFISSNAATLSDADGNLIMYTNGEEVWNNELDIVSSLSFAVNGDMFAPSLFIPSPGSENDYFLVLTRNMYSSFLKVINLRYDPVSNNISTLWGQSLTLDIIAKISATYHANGKDIWLLTHNYGSSDFWSYLVTDQVGISAPIISTIGSIQVDSIPTDLFSRVTWGEIQFSPGGNYVAMSSTGLNLIEIYDFDNETGIVSNLREIPLLKPKSIQFSSNGTFLYFSQHNKCQSFVCDPPLPYIGSMPIYQVDMLAGNDSAINASLFSVSSPSLLPPTDDGNYIRLASNGNIYCNMSGENIAVINNPNLPELNSNWSDSGVVFPYGYAGNQPYQQLPDFFTPYLDFNINFENDCFGDSTMIYTLTNQGFDSIRWEFEDTMAGLSFSILNTDTVSHTFSEPGNYEVTLKRYRNGNLDELKKILKVKPQVSITLPTDTILCEGSQIVLTANNTYCDFGWLNSITTDTVFSDTIYISDQAEYWAILTNFTEFCGDMDTIDVTLQINSLELGNDTFGVCSLNPIILDVTFDSTLSIVDEYIWSTGDTVSSIIATNSDMYSVTISQNSCFFTDTIQIGYISPVNISLPEDSIICEGNTAEFTALSTYYNYAWVNDFSNDTLFSNAIQISEPGTYWPVVTNYSIYCGSIDSINIIVHYDSLFIGNDTANACISFPLTLDATLDSATYLWSTFETTATIIATISNYYYVEVTQGYCTFFDTINILYDEPLIIDLPDTSIVCDSIPIELSVIDILADYLWSPTGETTPEIMVTNPGIYSVTASNGCGDFVDSTTVLSLPSPVVNLGNDTIICSTDSVFLNAVNPSSNYVWSVGSGDSSIWVNTLGQYFVTVTNECGNAYDSILIETENPVIVNLGNDTIICFGEELLITPEIIGEGTLQWSTGESTPEIVVIDEGEYILSVTNVCGDFLDSIYLIIQINSFAFTEDTLFVHSDSSGIIDAGAGYLYYDWSTGESTQSIIVTDTDIYWVTVTDTVGCEASDSIIVARPYSIFIPSSFQNIKIYPNPVSNELTIEGLKGDETITVSDLLGRQIEKIFIDKSSIVVSFHQQPEGVYILAIEREGEVKVYKLIRK